MWCDGLFSLSSFVQNATRHTHTHTQFNCFHHFLICLHSTREREMGRRRKWAHIKRWHNVHMTIRRRKPHRMRCARSVKIWKCNQFDLNLASKDTWHRVLLLPNATHCISLAHWCVCVCAFGVSVFGSLCYGYFFVGIVVIVFAFISFVHNMVYLLRKCSIRASPLSLWMIEPPVQPLYPHTHTHSCVSYRANVDGAQPSYKVALSWIH